MGRRKRRELEAAAQAAGSSPPAPSPRRATGHAKWWSWRTDGALAALVFVVAFVGFANSLGNDFVYDDLDVIKDNPRVAALDLKTILTTPYWTGEEVSQAGLYRPLTIASFAAERAAFGPGPKPVHATNVVLNALAAVLAFALALRLAGSRFVATSAALLWGVHSVHVEVVANGVGRSEILAALAVFGGMLFHLSWIQLRGTGRDGASRARRFLLGALACYLAGLLAKESAVMLPALAFLADWLLLERGRLSTTLSRLAGYLAYVVPLGIFLALRFAVIGTSTPAIQEVMGKTTSFERVLHASETLLRQLGQVLAPIWICGEYSDYRNLVHPKLGDPLVAASLVAWALLAVLLVVAWRRGLRGPVFGVAWFFVAIFPVSNLVIAIGTVRADRVLYVPSLGILLALSWLARPLYERARPVAMAIVAIAVVALCMRTAAGNREWASPEVFWASLVTKNPGSPIGWAHEGEQARKRGDLVASEADFRKAIELRDGAGFFHAAAHTNLGDLLASRGDLAQAEAEYRLVISKEPTRFVAVLNLGELLMRSPDDQARVREAAGYLETATTSDPKDFRGFANLAEARRLLGENEAALAAAQQARRLRPDIKDLWAVEAEILERLGRTAEAAKAMEEYRRR